MAVYVVPQEMSVYVESLGRDVRLHARQQLDDQFPEDAAIIAEWGPRGLIRQNVEQATAAPGETRNVRRKKEAA